MKAGRGGPNIMSAATLARLVRAVRYGTAPHHESGHDAALLGRWVDQGDQAAFELLLHRHGPMVWETCRRVLRHEHDAEDVFQAVFLTLARKAASIRRAPSLAGWLYRVAYRAALALRARPQHIVTGTDLDEVALAREAEVGESWRELLDEEVGRLPQRYREPFVLCYLEGRTTDEAAAALGCPRGTVGTRLAWARQRLKQRLQRRGVELPACLIPAAGALPGTVVESALQTAVAWTTHEAVPAAVSGLCQEMIKMMLLDRIKSVTVWLAPLVVLAVGGGWWLEARVQADKPAKPVVKPIDKPAKPGAQPDKPAKPGAKKGDPADVEGIVKEASNNDRTITVILGGKVKGEEPKTVTFTIDDKTSVLFTGVGPNEAKAQKGYRVSAWLAEKSKDKYARVLFSGPAGGKGPMPSVVGNVTAVANDGKSFTLTLAGKKKVKGNDQPEEKDREVTIKLAPKASLLFSGVGPGEAKLAKGLHAAVWLAKGSKDTATQVTLGGSNKPTFKKGQGNAPEFAGQVTAVSGDGKAFSVEIPPKAKGEAPTKVDVKLGQATRQLFSNVGPDGAKIQVGYHAVGWAGDKGKEAISLVAFTGASGKTKQAMIAGEVKAVANDGKSFTVHLPGKKGDEGKDVELKLGSDTSVTFHNVKPGGARICQGYQARAWLEEGSKDTAKMVILTGEGK
jgi:RNA polymerase sigma factor (sigma-70 family)